MATTPRAFAERYVASVNAARCDLLAARFAVDADFLGPGGQTFRGRARIAEFYAASLSGAPVIRLASVVEDGEVCVFELESRVDGEGFRLSAIDHVTLGSDGLAVRFAVYTR